MKIFNIASLVLLVVFSFDDVSAQIIRNRAIHFKRHRVTHHHHRK